jgi:ferritin-like metal-binding protein YciE
MTNLNELLQDEVQQLNAAEAKLEEKLSLVTQAATHAGLKDTLSTYIQQLRIKAERLNMVAALMQVNPTDGKCRAVKGLLKEAVKWGNLQIDYQVKDAGLIAVVQKIIHYKIAAYGTARHYADALDLTEATRVLSQSLEEEKAANQQLNDLAINEVNPLAIKVGAAVL